MFALISGFVSVLAFVAVFVYTHLLDSRLVALQDTQRSVELNFISFKYCLFFVFIYTVFVFVLDVSDTE